MSHVPLETNAVSQQKGGSFVKGGYEISEVSAKATKDYPRSSANSRASVSYPRFSVIFFFRRPSGPRGPFS